MGGGPRDTMRIRPNSLIKTSAHREVHHEMLPDPTCDTLYCGLSKPRKRLLRFRKRYKELMTAAAAAQLVTAGTRTSACRTWLEGLSQGSKATWMPFATHLGSEPRLQVADLHHAHVAVGVSLS